MSSHNILLACSQAFGAPGGIQTFMRLIARALAEEERLNGILSLCDAPRDPVGLQYASTHNIGFRGCAGSKVAFIRRTIASSAESVIFGHIAQAPIGLIWGATKRKAGYSIVLHGMEVWRKLPFLQLLAARRADTIICTTPYSAGEFLSCNPSVAAKKIRMLPLALEEERFPTISHAPKANGRLELLSVCRVVASEPGKGIDHTICALRHLRWGREKVRYTLIGSGDDLPRLKKLAVDCGVEQVVEFKGAVSDAELRQAYQRADVFIMPSKQEGFGLAYLEAMYYALPVIACAAGGVPYVVTDGVTGILTRYGASDEIALAIEKMASRQFRTILAAQAAADIDQRFRFAAFRNNLRAIVAQSKGATEDLRPRYK